MKRKKYEIKIILIAAVLLASAIFITILSFILQPVSYGYAIDTIIQTPIIFFYNFLPVLIFAMFIFFLTNNVWVGTLVTSMMVTLFSIVNRYKIIFREDPFVPMDIPLAKEAISITIDSKISISSKLILLVLLILITNMALIIYVKNKKIRLITRVIGALICVGIALLSNSLLYSSKTIFNKLPINGHPCEMKNIFNSKGFVYSFLYSINAYRIDTPDGYNKNEVKKMIDEYTRNYIGESDNKNEKPHIIMIMGEAFSDISENENLKFSEREDPLHFYKTIKDENIINGYIITSAFGGGTANTEFDSLTGCITANISESSTSSFRLIRKRTYALPHVLKGLGYYTIGIHPGYDWFYNRKNVYKHLGFDESIFKDEFDVNRVKGQFISEEATVDKIIEVFQNHLKNDEQTPLFLYCVTIQNHSPYIYYKYGGKTKPTFETELTLTDTAIEHLTSYFIGIKDMDTGISNLVEYFYRIDKPVIIVYYGDHLPNLGPDYLAYKEIGYNFNTNGTIEQQLNVFKTPFFIWRNEKSEQLNLLDELDMPDNNTIGVNYLPGLILELINQKDASPFLHFTNIMRKKVPVITRYNYLIGNEFTSDLPASLKNDINKYKNWQYYIMTNGMK